MSFLTSNPILSKVIVTTQALIDSPTAQMLADYSALYTTGIEPIVRYQSNGTTLEIATQSQETVDALINSAAVGLADYDRYLAEAIALKITIGADISNTSGTLPPSRVTFTSGPANGLTLEEAVADLYARTQGGGVTQPVVNAAPSVAFPDGTADVGETATITAATYTSGTVLSKSWDIRVNGAVVSNTTQLTFTVPTGADVGQRAIAVTENAVWANGTVSSTSATYTVNAPAQVTTPVELSAPSITGTNAADTSTLTGVHGTYSGGTILSYTYRWLRDGVAIGGATSQTYAKTSDDYGHTVYFEETPTNAVGAATSASVSIGLPILSAVTATYLLIDSNTITRLQSRFQSGPFKASGDAFTGSPGDADRIIANAAVVGLESDPGNISTASHGGYVQLGCRTRDRALCGIVQNNSTYRTTAISELLTMLANTNWDISLYNFSPSADGHATDGMVSQTYYGIRLLWTYALLKPYMSAPNIATAEAKFTQWGTALQTYATNRQTSDLNGKINGPTGVWYGGDPSAYAYITSGGLQNRLSTLSVSYNNRCNPTIVLLGLLGIQLGNTTWKSTATNFLTDYLKYGVFPDGSISEYTRNGDYSTPQQGLRYGAICIQAQIIYAEALRIAGDSSFFSVSTTLGKDGTAGTAKSLSLMIDTDLDVRRKIKSWYSAAGGATSPISTNTHIGKQVAVVNGATGTDSAHFLGFLMARTGLPALDADIQGCCTGDTTGFAGLEPFPGQNGASVDSGGNVTPFEDVLAVIPAPLLFYSDDIAPGGGGGAADVPTVEGTATTVSSTSGSPAARTINKPSTGVTVAVDDDLYFVLSTDGSSITGAGPSGFTQVGSSVMTNWLDQQVVSVWRRRATSADVAPSTYSYTSPSDDHVAQMFVVRGALDAAPTLTGISDTNGNAGYASGALDIVAPSASAGVSNLVIRVLSGEVSSTGAVTYSTPTPTQTAIGAIDNGGYSSFKTFYATQESAGVTGTVTADNCTFTGGGTATAIAMTIVIEPA